MKWFLSLSCLGSVLLIVACSQPRSGTLGNGFGDGSLNNGTQSPEPAAQFDFNDNGTLDLGGGFEDAANTTQDSVDTLRNTPGVDPNLVEGMTTAGETLSQFSNAYSQLIDGTQPQQVFPILQDIQSAKIQAWQTAQLLWQLGLVDLARVFADEAHKVEILRYFHPQNSRHFFTSSRPEGFQASTLLGYHLEGVAFRVYGSPRNGCARPIFRCYKPAEDVHFMSSSQSCEGQQYIGNFGFVCSEKRPGAFHEIRRLFGPNGDYLSTVNPTEIEHVVNILKWKDEGSLGFAPN